MKNKRYRHLASTKNKEIAIREYNKNTSLLKHSNLANLEVKDKDSFIYGNSTNGSPARNPEITLDPILEAGEKGFQELNNKFKKVQQSKIDQEAKLLIERTDKIKKELGITTSKISVPANRNLVDRSSSSLLRNERELSNMITKSTIVGKAVPSSFTPVNGNTAIHSGRISPSQTIGVMDLLKYQMEEKRLLELKFKLKDKEIMNLMMQNDEELNQHDKLLIK